MSSSPTYTVTLLAPDADGVTQAEVIYQADTVELVDAFLLGYLNRSVDLVGIDRIGPLMIPFGNGERRGRRHLQVVAA